VKRRLAVEQVRGVLGRDIISERRACRVLGQVRSTQRRERYPPGDEPGLLRRMGKRAGVEKVKVHRFRHTFATWAIENEARELDVQYLLGHSTPAMVRRYSATYDAEKAARAHERFSPADRMGERLR